jgi:hypothetical protein
MNLIRRLWQFFVARHRAPEPYAADTALAWEDRYGYLGAVGESHYQAALKSAARNGRLCRATLRPEPENPFDVNAVVVEVGGQTVGYLCRADARRYQRRLLARGVPMNVPAKLIGGEPGKPSFGILLDCREVEQLPKPKPVRKKKAAVPEPDQPF